jgi:hypothetical protein
VFVKETAVTKGPEGRELIFKVILKWSCELEHVHKNMISSHSFEMIFTDAM